MFVLLYFYQESIIYYRYIFYEEVSYFVIIDIYMMFLDLFFYLKCMGVFNYEGIIQQGDSDFDG